MAMISDVYDNADRMVLAARELDKVMAVIADSGSRDFSDAIKYATEVGAASEDFLKSVEAWKAGREKS